MNALQEQIIGKIILQSKDNERLLQITETAQMAMSAWTVLKQWQVSVHHPLFSCAEDYAAMQRWGTMFEKQCRQRNWITAAELPDLLMQLVREDVIKLPEKIDLVGFTEISPQMKEFVSPVIAASQTALLAMTTFRKDDQVSRLKLETPTTEIQTIARWAKATLEKNPQANIACVFPALETNRERIKQIFTEVFAQDNTFTIDTDNIPFNISAGKSLSEYPVIHTALQLLQLHKKIISRETLSHLLTSPFLGESQAESSKRANLDRDLRKKNVTQLNLADNLNLISKFSPRLAKRLQKFYELLSNEKETQSYTDWASH